MIWTEGALVPFRYSVHDTRVEFVGASLRARIENTTLQAFRLHFNPLSRTYTIQYRRNSLQLLYTRKSGEAVYPLRLFQSSL